MYLSEDEEVAALTEYMWRSIDWVRFHLHDALANPDDDACAVLHLLRRLDLSRNDSVGYSNSMVRFVSLHFLLRTDAVLAAGISISRSYRTFSTRSRGRSS